MADEQHYAYAYQLLPARVQRLEQKVQYLTTRDYNTYLDQLISSCKWDILIQELPHIRTFTAAQLLRIFFTHNSPAALWKAVLRATKITENDLLKLERCDKRNLLLWQLLFHGDTDIRQWIRQTVTNDHTYKVALVQRRFQDKDIIQLALFVGNVELLSFLQTLRFPQAGTLVFPATHVSWSFAALSDQFLQTPFSVRQLNVVKYWAEHIGPTQIGLVFSSMKK